VAVEPLPVALIPEALSGDGPVRDLPGLTQADPRHAAEPRARLAAIGFQAMNPRWDGSLCLPGGVTHWIGVSAGETVYLQGSVSLAMAQGLGGGADVSAEALAATLSRPERLAVALRSATLAGDGAAVTGALLGADLAAMKPMWLGQEVAVIGSGAPVAAMRQALEAQGVMVTLVSDDAACQRGFEVLGATFGAARHAP